MRPHIEEQLLANPIKNIDDLDKFCNYDLMVCALKKMAEKNEITILWMPNLGYGADMLGYMAHSSDPKGYSYNSEDWDTEDVEEIDAKPFQIFTPYSFQKFLAKYVQWMAVLSEEDQEDDDEHDFGVDTWTLDSLSLMIEWAEVTVGNTGTFISLPNFGYEDQGARGMWDEPEHWCHTWKNGRFEKPQE